MRKVIFEQVGNIILAALFTGAATQTVLQSKFDHSPKNFSIELSFGKLWLVFIAAIVIFSLMRTIYGKKFGAADGYSKKMGEMSAQDEREKIVGMQAAAFTYRMMLYVLALMLLGLMFSNIFISSFSGLRAISIAILGSCLTLTFLIYLVAWLNFDHRI